MALKHLKPRKNWSIYYIHTANVRVERYSKICPLMTGGRVAEVKLMCNTDILLEKHNETWQ